MLLKIAISTCPNDTFMFEALLNNRIDTRGYTFQLTLADIDVLNQRALETDVDITKISISAYSQISETYQLLRSGAAIGFSNGPLIVSKSKIYPEELPYVTVAIPGENTTANLLLSKLYPQVKHKEVYLFSDIEEAIMDNEVDAGVIIHESRFTYKQRGLLLVSDLGVEWEKRMRMPLPLGAIAIKRNLPESVKHDIQRVLAQSVQYALNNPKDSGSFVKHHAQELDDEVISKHIQLYVNSLSTWINPKGEEAIREVLSIALAENAGKLTEPVFIQ
ncbi:MAG: 1,4-dihydroxy-6-naphthoate synthase [Salinivirgaceae bacterium]|nr:1,4-dihydroxy-6-naphthoate synthase [Salinivirgaceae bacterium]MDY0280664.1 1,4-dihydroxy-6-naphthoate synthase [Salinivirgaceae bacterium]